MVLGAENRFGVWLVFDPCEFVKNPGFLGFLAVFCGFWSYKKAKKSQKSAVFSDSRAKMVIFCYNLVDFTNYT